MYLPYNWSQVLQFFNFGAEPYGLFAVMTGVAGRPVAVLEGAYSLDGPWLHIPFLYQINDPSLLLPLCFPHFPRLDWTLWFVVPLGEMGKWIQQLLCGIVTGDPAIVDGLLDGPSFYHAFPDGPPEFVCVIPRLYESHPDSTGWLVLEDPASPMIRRVFSQDSLLHVHTSSEKFGWTRKTRILCLGMPGHCRDSKACGVNSRCLIKTTVMDPFFW